MDTRSEPSGDKKALLNQLRIDRDAPAEDTGKPIVWFVVIALVAGAGFGWWYLVPSTQTTLPVRTAVAIAGSSQPIGSSVLDATGYVVARRQATVSSKTTGKVVEVLIEEGVVVEAGQLLARLDDSIPRAQHALAASQLESARAGLAELEVSLKQARLDLQRTTNLAKRNLASQADLDRDALSVEALIARLERARREINVAERVMGVQAQILSDMQIRAPFAGVVIAKAAQPGEMISPVSAGGGFTRTGICTIVDMNSLEITDDQQLDEWTTEVVQEVTDDGTKGPDVNPADNVDDDVVDVTPPGGSVPKSGAGTKQPTKGRLPTAGVTQLSSTFDTTGTLARTVADSAFFFGCADPAWGEPTEGVRTRLLASKRIWRANEQPVFSADVANDGAADSNAATVTIAVDPVNDAPVATGDNFTVSEDETLTVAAPPP